MKWYCGTAASRHRVGTSAVYRSEFIDERNGRDVRGVYRQLRRAGVDPSLARLTLSTVFLAGVSARREMAVAS